MYTPTTEQIIGSYAVKYKTLIPLINNNYAGCNDNIINIFIDLAEIYSHISHTPASVNSFSVASSVINLCAHYRNFFATYYKTDTRFFIIFSNVDDPFCVNRKFIPNYKRKLFVADRLKENNSLFESMNLIDMLAPYLNDIMFCKTTYEFGVKVLDIVSHFKNPNLIITKDPYNLQLVSEEIGFVNILRCRKDKDGDSSYIVSGLNAINEMCKVRSIDPAIGAGINPSMVSLIYALSRVPERYIPSLCQLPKVIKSICKAVSSGLILNEHTVDIDYVIKILSEQKLIDIKDPEYVKMRYRAIDIEYQYMIYMNDPKEQKFSKITNLYDPVAVKEISMKYFKKYPLDLNVL